MAIEATQEATVCVCSHSMTAHGLHGDAGCGFCSCARFTRPASSKQEVQLGKYASAAFELLSKDPTMREQPKDALAEFVKDGHGRMYAAGSYLVSRGESSHNLYVILEGTATVSENDAAPGQRLGPGSIAGDIRAFTEEARYASVTSEDNVMALEIDVSKLKSTFSDYPNFFGALVQLVGKYSDSADDVIVATVQAALEQQTVDAAEQRREGLDPDKAADIAARWRQLKEEDRESADRAQQVARAAIDRQTKTGR